MQINPQPGQKGGKLQPSTMRGWGVQGKAGEGGLSPSDLTPTPVFSKDDPLPTSHFSNLVGKMKN